MKRFVMLALVSVLAALAMTATAGARDTALTPTERNLQNQITALQRSTKALTKQVATLKKTDKDLVDGISLAIVLDECTNALTADALQGTWAVIDQISAATQAGKTYFGAQTPLDDSGVCTALGVSRSQVVPPTVAGFNTLLGLLKQSSMLSRRVAL